MTQFLSKDKRVLIVADPHQDMARLRHILGEEKYDLCLVLGDWWDSFDYDTDRDVRATCEVLKQHIYKPNFFTLFGNHDLHYLFDNKYTICSGYEGRKHKVIKSSLGNELGEIRDKFKWYFWIDDYLCTHAGIHQYHIPPMTELTKPGISAWLDDQAGFADRSIISDNYHWFYLAGAARGGRVNFGGITWLDFNREFKPIEGIKQIVGHTTQKCVLNHIDDGNVDLTKSNDLCIDCNLVEYLIIEDGKLEVKKFKEL